jgi:hypothetical protein
LCSFKCFSISRDIGVWIVYVTFNLLVLKAFLNPRDTGVWIVQETLAAPSECTSMLLKVARQFNLPLYEANHDSANNPHIPALTSLIILPLAICPNTLIIVL